MYAIILYKQSYAFSYPDKPDPWKEPLVKSSQRDMSQEASHNTDPLCDTETVRDSQQREKTTRDAMSDFTLEIKKETDCGHDADRDFFMAMAMLTSKRSKDPNRQVCVVIHNNFIISYMKF